MNRKYNKNSWVGKIYKWAKGNHFDTDSCSVRKVVFWNAPIKLLFKQKLFSIDDDNVGMWFLWHTTIQIYVVANWGRMSGGLDHFIGLEFLMLPVLPIVAVITIFEALLVVIIVIGGIITMLQSIEDRVRGKVVTPIENRMRTISDPVGNYFAEWWDELKNKLCKPVTWIE